VAVGAAATSVGACLEALGLPAADEAAVIAVRDNSRISRVRAGERMFAVKECRVRGTAMPDTAGAESEYGALVRLADAAAAAGRHSPCPRPVALCREHAAYAMSWASGRTATRLAMAVTCSTPDARAIGARAGHWLLGFHRLHPLPDRTGDYVAKLAHVDDAARRASAAEPSLRTAAAALRDTAERCARVSMPASWVHGDMKSDNILLDTTEATGIDARLLDENTVAYDLVPFLNHARLLRWSARGWWAQRKPDALVAGFLGAYDGDWAAWKPALSWLQAYMLMQSLASAATHGWRGAISRAALRAELRRAVADLHALAGATAR
jgi:aminoglycoside phosphotransferase (APT) family kinase protein